MEKIIADYYTGLFSSLGSTNIEEALHSVQPRVSSYANEPLLVPPTAVEIKEALFQMHPTKAPSVDGMHALFYQKFWEALHSVQPRVSSYANEPLFVPPTAVEIKEALFQMHPTKAPGVDVMHALFYQKFWGVVGLMFYIQQWWNGHVVLEDINHTVVALIPKISELKYIIWWPNKSGTFSVKSAYWLAMCSEIESWQEILAGDI
ncbi:LOW QUALITY PROTEIN: hypothetical protein V2J09_018562 [Rumex salicifolius]